MNQVDEGIFLFRTGYSETSLIATFYTRESGIKKFIFRGGKKKAHSLFPMSICDLVYYERRESELVNLTTADPSIHLTFQFDPIRSSIAFFIAEVTRKCLDSNHKDAELYDFLKVQIIQLNSALDLSNYPIDFMIGFSQRLGFHPLVEGESNCFNFEDGIIGQFKGTHGDEGEQIMLIRDRIQHGDQHFRKELKSKALSTLISYLAYHIPRMEKIETLEIVREVLN